MHALSSKRKSEMDVEELISTDSSGSSSLLTDIVSSVKATQTCGCWVWVWVRMV